MGKWSYNPILDNQLIFEGLTHIFRAEHPLIFPLVFGGPKVVDKYSGDVLRC